MDAIYELNIVEGPVVVAVFGLAAVVFAVLVAKRMTLARLSGLLLGGAVGALVGLAVYVLWNAGDAFDLFLPTGVGRRLAATFGAVGVAVACLWDAAAWRRVVAAVGVLVFALAGGVGINAYFGIDRTLGALLGVTAGPSIDLGAVPKESTAPPQGPLYEWTPPANLPAVGRRGTVDIPSTGFAARRGSVYLPPAALAQNPPRLPLVVFMMGFPGTPDPTDIADVLDKYAAQHRGLAPIVVVADQIGTRGDPACVDSKAFGPAESYILKDVVTWARKSLNVLDDAAHTAIGGYSNGGACAFKLAAERPDLFGTLISISGEEFPGAESQAVAIRDAFAGDAKAFEAAKPANILARNPGKYSRRTAVFTVGGDDAAFTPGVHRASQAAQKAGMTTSLRIIPGAGHVRGAVAEGLTAAFEVLYPVLGLYAPR